MILSRYIKKIYEYFLVTLGAFLNAFSLHVFVNPNQLIPGGFSGIASLLYYIIPHSNMSIIYILINIPLLIGAVIYIKGDFTVKTIWATTVATVMLAILPEQLIFVDAPLIGVIFGGFAIGVSMYLAHLGHGSNGGTEVIARMVAKKHPEKDMSHTILASNMVVLAIGSFVMLVYQGASVLTIVYSIIFVVLGGSSLEILTKGFNHPQKYIIITKHHKEISKNIVKKLRRGSSTINTYQLDGTVKGQAIILICQYRQSSLVKRIIRTYDKDAFVIVKDVNYVFSRPDFIRSYRYEK